MGQAMGKCVRAQWVAGFGHESASNGQRRTKTSPHPTPTNQYVEGCWGFTHLKIEKLVRITIFSFHVFDRNEIHIQAFREISTAKLMLGDSSSSTFRDFQISSFLIIKNSGILNFKNSHDVSEISRFLSFRFPQKIFPKFVQGRSLVFLIFLKYLV